MRSRTRTGSSTTAEIRLLVAHPTMIHRTMAGLGPTGVQAARNTPTELAKAVVCSGFDDAEPQLYPALTQAAKDLAKRRLADPDLGPTMLANELHVAVSVRTLQRAFAATGWPLSDHIRARRLEKARSALLTPFPPSVSGIASHWQFADSSHFSRVFTKRYGLSPADYTRQT